MLKAMIFLGARKGEVFRIKMLDLDFENAQIRLWTRKRKNGNLEADWLPMVPELKDELWYWQQTRLTQATADQEHLFVCLDRTAFCQAYYGKPFTSRQHLMRRLCRKAGIEPFGFHAIRHLCATLLFHAGNEVSFIQKVLRHENPTTTERYLEKFGLTKTKEKLNLVFGRGSAVLLPDLYSPVQVSDPHLCPRDVSRTGDEQRAA